MSADGRRIGEGNIVSASYSTHCKVNKVRGGHDHVDRIDKNLEIRHPTSSDQLQLQVVGAICCGRELSVMEVVALGHFFR